MILVNYIIIAAAVLNYGFMLYDGVRALTQGDYLRPKSGEYAGQLGPWSKVARSAGIDPESVFMKVMFVIWGLTGLAITLCFALGMDWAWTGMLILSISSLWYLVPGTALSLLQIILLIVLKVVK